jgi:alpha-beta hydrolase superfamily lysophospholipase
MKAVVYALDLRDGRTANSTDRVEQAGGMDECSDVQQLANRARADFPSLPVVLFGHSMGSLIAQAYVERSDAALAGYVLSGSAGLTEVVPEFATMLHEALRLTEPGTAANLGVASR